MDLFIGVICFTAGACLGFLAAALCLLARDLDDLEEYEHRIAGR